MQEKDGKQLELFDSPTREATSDDLKIYDELLNRYLKDIGIERPFVSAFLNRQKYDHDHD